MNKVAIYPGTFDPITFGHIDVIKKGLKFFDKIVVAVSDVDNKNYLFDADERKQIVKKALFSDLKLDKKKILIISFTSLTTDLCRKYKSKIILRRFESKKLRVFKGRSSKGIKGIVLAPKDQIVSLSIIDNDKNSKNGKKTKDDKLEIKAKEKFILSITENGFGKKTSHNDYRVTNRGGKGIIGIINSPRNGNISSSFPVYDGDEILISTNKGRVIRVAVKEIRTAGRNTQGVRIIKLSGEEKVVSADKIDDNLV